MAKETPSTVDVEALKRENEELKAKLSSGELPADLAAEVKWRMELGLPRAQAIEAGRAQIDWDKQQAAAAAEAAKKTK